MTTETSIYEFAKRSAEQFAAKTALWFYGKGISYQKLFEKIDRVADNLHCLGVCRGTVVTIHLPNCPQAVMAIYAVAKLGGICNMVHPQVPWNGLKSNMEFCESKILITGGHFSQADQVASDITSIYVSISDYMGEIYRFGYKIKNRNQKPQHAVGFSDLEKVSAGHAPVIQQESLSECCVAYLNSSGTTGTPKTVMHCHRAFNNWVHNAQAFFRHKGLADEVVLTALPFFHGSGLVMNLHQVLCGGGEQILFAKWDAKLAAKLVKKKKITIITGVPFLYQSLIEQKGFRAKDVGHITQCFVSGDHVPLELKEKFDAVVGHRALFEGYGMTETVTACFSTSRYDDCPEASGYPLINAHAAVLAEDDKLHQTGCGEFFLSTNTMMMGYLKDPKATGAVVVERDGKTWFRTGDYGEIDENGYLFFYERMKNIIIRNGYNIYPYEIEALIQRLDYVAETAVIGCRAETSKGEDIVAFVAIGPSADQEEIRKEILKISAENLPKYSIPNEIVFVEKLPRNRMNKIDVKALKEIYEGSC